MDRKGGRVAIAMGGQNYSARAAAKITPSNVTLKNGANTDGTGYTTVEASLTMLELTFDRGIFKWDTAMMLLQLDVTLQEIDVKGKPLHLFTACSWDGTPTLDTATGEVTGLKCATDKYTPPS